MNTTLVLALHYSPAALAVLRDKLGPAVEVRGEALAGLSAVYVNLALKIRDSKGHLLAPLAKRLGATHELADYDGVFLVTWSAPYSFARALLETGTDADKLTGWISLDSGYSGKDGDGTAADAQVKPFIALVTAASCGDRLCWAGYTDVATVPSVANTGAFWSEVQRLSGIAPSGLFRLDHWPGRTGDDHVAARDTHGPSFVAGALAAWRASRGAAPTEAPPAAAPAPSGCEGVLAAARAELEAGVREEPPGSNDGPALRRYGARLHAAGGTWAPGWAWCALFAWQCADAAGVPLPPAVAVHVLVEWARAAGQWHERDAVPQPGWLAIFARGGHDPRHGGEGHVAVVESYDEHGYVTIGGNEGDRVRRTARSLAAETPGNGLVGWIALG